MFTDMDDADNVFDLNEAIPETELLDNSIQKGRAQLSVKARRHRPSRSRYRDSVSSTEGDDSLDRKDTSQSHTANSPLNLGGSSPSPDDALLAPRSPAFSFDTSLVRRPDDAAAPPAAPPRGRYRQLTNATSQEALVTHSSSPSRSCPSSNGSPIYMRRSRRPDSEVLVSDTSQDTTPPDPGSPTVVLDKKTKRRFLDLGVTLRRSYIRVRRDKSSRLSVRDQSPSRSSFVSLSWLTEGRGSLTPPCSPKAPPQSPPTPCRSHSQESVLSDEFSPPPSSSPPVDSRSSHPYHTLSSDEPDDESLCVVSTWTTQQVCQWLRGLNMEQYVPEFSAKDVDGRELLQLDGSRLKGLGVLSSSDRSSLKRRIKEIHAAAEKEKKALDKLEKQKEKQRRKEQEQRRN